MDFFVCGFTHITIVTLSNKCDLSVVLIKADNAIESEHHRTNNNQSDQSLLSAQWIIVVWTKAFLHTGYK